MSRLNGVVDNLSLSFQDDTRGRRKLLVYDCRFEDRRSRTDTGPAERRQLETSHLDFDHFLQEVSKEFSISSKETFVVMTTDRTVLDCNKFEELQDGQTLHLFQNETQVLSAATEQFIRFTPHYHTMVESGMYEYYNSEEQSGLPYAFAELIDNALSATSKNVGVRTIEIISQLDEAMGKPAVMVLDNGCGMTSKQLNNWAVYRLSKFTRQNSTFGSENAGYVRPDPVPRSLNSDISYFGVGGKQAAFFIGDSTRIITKAKGSLDVHELILSKEEFERKEKNNEDIYSGIIRNRKVGDSSHVKEDGEQFLIPIIAMEFEKESFTAVIITGVVSEHVALLKEQFHLWTRELAHIYHYYIHGVHGNGGQNSRPNLDIQITLREKLNRPPRIVELKQVQDDMQTLYISAAAADTFEFNACANLDSKVEGVLRYHPFLYDKETYPADPSSTQAPPEESEDDTVAVNQARGKRPIFECFWNGRLIPYTTVSEFDWCARPKKGAPLPAECYSRFSGVLFSNDRFPVSKNKLKFMDLELQLKDKATIFTRVVNGQEQRVKIHKEFNQWLKNCHERLDKQVKFVGYKATVTRTDVNTKRMQHPWATFSSIVWDEKTYKAGQCVKLQRSHVYGSIEEFLLYGDHDGDVYSTCGQVKLALEPRALHDEFRTVLISKIDRTVTKAAINKAIGDDLAKLPDNLKVKWPKGNPWSTNAVQPAGTILGPLHVEILNKKGDSISTMPSGGNKKLMIELRVVWHGPNGDQETNSHIAQFSSKWAYWFKTMENLNKLGKHTLYLNTVLNESNASFLAGKELPSYKLHFTITEGSAVSFVVGALSSPLHVGVPFDIPLEFVDDYDHPAMPPVDAKPGLECSGLDVSYEYVVTCGTTLTIRGVRVSGKVQSYHSKTHDLKVVLPGLRQDSQTVKISLLPGKPHSLHVTPDESPVTIENKSPMSFNIEIHDEAGNITAHPKMIVRCQVPELQTVAVDCSATGAGLLVTKPIDLKMTKGEEKTISVKFDLLSMKHITAVVRELRVVPSTQVTLLEVYCESSGNVLRDKEEVAWGAGDVLDNLNYRLYDEGGREVPLTDGLASRIKVNWTADVNLEDVAQGNLPTIQVQTLVHEKHFYQVSYQDQNVLVNTSFTVIPLPDEAKQLKATLSDCNIRMGEALPGMIYLELIDQYGNVTEALTSASVDQITAEGEGLDKSTLALTWQESNRSVVVSGVRFQPGTPGTRELSFTWKDFVEHVRVRLNAGVPAQLKLTSGPQQPLQVLNEKGIPTPFLLQLCDAWGNPSTDQRVVVELKPSTPDLKVTSSVISQPVDAEGKAVFTVKSVSGPKGEYELKFRGALNRKPLPAPSVKLTVIPDPDRPVRLSVEYDAMATFPAGGTLPVFSVTVVSEAGSPVRNVKPGALSMMLWRGESSTENRPPKGTIPLKCSKPRENEKNDRFHFREKVIPQQSGKYTIQFSVHMSMTVLDKTQLYAVWSHLHVINVVANGPIKLAPDCQPPTPVISNNDVVANRTLVEDMTLVIMDTYDNWAGLALQGKVVVTMKSSSGGDSKDLPQFIGKVSHMKFELEMGKAHISNLAIMENSPGQDGGEYILHFEPVVEEMKEPLASFELPFRFYNDVENQRQVSELSKKKDQLSVAITAYKGIFTNSRKLYKLLTAQLEEANTRMSIIRTELRKKNANESQPTSISEINDVLRETGAETERIKQQPRRVCSLNDPFQNGQDVLGKVGHLALLLDDTAARAVSWHISRDMNCVITNTTAAAQRIYDDTNGMQEVMALDAVFFRQSDRPLPHIRDGQNIFHPTGNPVFVKDLLIYPKNDKECQKVFGNILSETILMDDLDSANSYRRAVVQSGKQCPTILTRKGERISQRGTFGGAHNKAPPIDRLPCVFGAPLPPDYYDLQEQIDLLQHYRVALLRSQHAHSEMQKLTPDMERKQGEMDQKLQQMQEVEEQLASSTPVKRKLPGETPGSSMKKARQRSK